MYLPPPFCSTKYLHFEDIAIYAYLVAKQALDFIGLALHIRRLPTPHYHLQLPRDRQLKHARNCPRARFTSRIYLVTFVYSCDAVEDDINEI